VASKHREQKVIAAIACPTCGAAVGQLCRRTRDELARVIGPTNRPLLCRDRVVAWQLLRDGVITDGD
jgi:hypothetical protein